VDQSTYRQYKRQTLNIFAIIHRYLKIKKASPEERKKIEPWTFIFAGKAAPGELAELPSIGGISCAGYYIAKLVIRLIVNVGKVVVSCLVQVARTQLTRRTMTPTWATSSECASSRTTACPSPRCSFPLRTSVSRSVRPVPRPPVR
jgi:hypothetical protein